MHRSMLVCGAATCLIALSGCSHAPSIADVGVGPGTRASPLTIYVRACSRSAVHAVWLAEHQGGSRTSFGVPIYWQVVSREGSARSVYFVGQRPSGFETTVSLADLPREAHFFFEVNVDEAGMGFALEDLRRGQVYTSDYRYVPTNTYLDPAEVSSRTSICEPLAAGHWRRRLLRDRRACDCRRSCCAASVVDHC